MKKLSMILFAAGSMFFTSCKNDCKDVECGDFGTCDEGVCICDAGYENTDTENCVGENAKYVGLYNVSDVVTSSDNPGNAGTYTYESSVTAGTTVSDISFTNFGGFGSTVTATVTGASFTIPQQTDASGRKFAGNGTISGTTLTVTYTVTYSDGTVDNGQATYTRK